MHGLEVGFQGEPSNVGRRLRPGTRPEWLQRREGLNGLRQGSLTAGGIGTRKQAEVAAVQIRHLGNSTGADSHMNG